MKGKNQAINTKTGSTEWIYQFWAWQLLAWSLYRYFFHLPEWADELIAKPIVFVLPVLWWLVRKERKPIASIGITKKNFRQSLLIGFGAGAAFFGIGILSNTIKYGSLTMHPIAAVGANTLIGIVLLSLITAGSEELLNRGFLFSRLYQYGKNLFHSVSLSSIMFVLFHVPILVTSLRFEGATLVSFFFSTLLLGVANALSFAVTQSLVAPVLIHFFWNITVALFL